jgi:hypothetical protein
MVVYRVVCCCRCGGRFCLGSDKSGLTAQLNGSGTGASSGGQSLSFRGLCLCLIGKQADFRGR